MNKVTHFHLPVDNVERAKEFYQKIFDWQIMDSGFDRDYQIINTVATDEQGMPLETGAINGALFKREKVEECPSVVVTVESIDESLLKIESMGGTVIRPKEQVMEMGYFAEITDSEGNLIGLWEDLE
ncbi:VOC family protein [Methanococcoides methylutens]|uniref:VOC family protein n=1 Tax=Methanococcoides methylutens TaxID=2226 RepID=UPI004043F8D7